MKNVGHDFLALVKERKTAYEFTPQKVESRSINKILEAARFSPSSHNSGMGGRYTRSHMPVKLVYFEKKKSRKSAMKRELEIKSLSRSAKELLVKKMPNPTAKK